MDRKEKSISLLNSRLSERNLTLLESLDKVDYKLKHRVHCNICGFDFSTRLSDRDLRCPSCTDRPTKNIDLSYKKTITFLEEKGFIPLFTREDWQGARKGSTFIKYPLQCKKCGYTFDSSIVPSRLSSCRNCDTVSIRAFTSYIERCHKDSITPLFDRSTWKGTSVKYQVRCNICGQEFETRIRSDNPITCPYCYSLSIKEPSWDILKTIERNSNVTALVSKENWMGFTHYEGDSRISNSITYRCNSCGTEFISYGRPHKDKVICPICVGGCHSPEKSFFRFQKMLEESHLELLDTREDFKGFTHNGSYLKYKVKCLDCGRITEVYYYPKYGGSMLSKCPCKMITSTYRSSQEKEVQQWLESKNIQVISCDRKVLQGRGLDIYLPDYKIGFEFNGMFFHSSSPLNPSRKPKDYHRMKTVKALEQGVSLYHIWEDCPEDLLYSVIESKLGLTQRIFARKLKLVENLDPVVGNLFFEENHIDGNNKQAERYIALVDSSNTVMCCMSLMRRRIQATGEFHWEIGRFANIKHVTVVGGYSRILKSAISFLKSMQVTKLVSYCNRDISPNPDSTFYSKYGFKFVAESAPIYWYWTSNPIEINNKTYLGRVSRQTVQKQKLIKHFLSQGLEVLPTDTELSLCTKLGLVPVYNSGNFKYELTL